MVDREVSDLCIVYTRKYTSDFEHTADMHLFEPARKRFVNKNDIDLARGLNGREERIFWVYTATAHADGYPDRIDVKLPRKTQKIMGIDYDMEPSWDDVVEALQAEVNRRELSWYQRQPASTSIKREERPGVAGAGPSPQKPQRERKRKASSVGIAATEQERGRGAPLGRFEGTAAAVADLSSARQAALSAARSGLVFAPHPGPPSARSAAPYPPQPVHRPGPPMANPPGATLFNQSQSVHRHGRPMANPPRADYQSPYASAYGGPPQGQWGTVAPGPSSGTSYPPQKQNVQDQPSAAYAAVTGLPPQYQPATARAAVPDFSPQNQHTASPAALPGFLSPKQPAARPALTLPGFPSQNQPANKSAAPASFPKNQPTVRPALPGFSTQNQPPARPALPSFSQQSQPVTRLASTGVFPQNQAVAHPFSPGFYSPNTEPQRLHPAIRVPTVPRPPPPITLRTISDRNNPGDSVDPA